ncbi:MAG TPA: glycosyltransferase [Verrucomicrobiae bacterium]|nr:glycosyltransferase [Verrucomicrobiae bacterium]
MDKPLISFVVWCHNQESFIREAVESAFAQSYSPLEIIISDDCSTDRSFSIVKEMVAAYKGPHVVHLNRNDKQLGMGGHVNRTMSLSHGELVVAAAGDDVSLPHRTQTIYEAWEQSGRRATSVFSSYTIIAADGAIRGVGGERDGADSSKPCQMLNGNLLEFLLRRTPVVNGCSHAWSPVLFSYFGPLQSDLEDLVLSFRSLAIGAMLYIHEPLMKYRRHGANASFLAEGETITFDRREWRLRLVDEQNVKAYDNMLSDIEVLRAEGRISSAERDRLAQEARLLRERNALERKMMDGNMLQRAVTLADAIRRGYVRCALRASPRLLPRSIYRALYVSLRDCQP